MQDIAVLTGGQVVSGDYGMELKDATFDMLGRARQVKVSKENTIIVGGAGTKEAIADRVAQIKNQYEVSTSDYDREKLMERLARLSGGVAVIKVGAATEAEMKEKKLRVEDALNATKAAVEEGIVAGGGTAYVQAGIAAEKVVTELEGDEKTGAAIVAKALQAPLMQIAANAGLEGAVILNQVRGSEIPGYGFDAAKEEYCDMIAAGIVDPTKVCRSALENAASVASTVLTTEAMVVSIPEPPRRLPPRRTWAACTKSSPHFRIKYTALLHPNRMQEGVSFFRLRPLFRMRRWLSGTLRRSARLLSRRRRRLPENPPSCAGLSPPCPQASRWRIQHRQARPPPQRGACAPP